MNSSETMEGSLVRITRCCACSEDHPPLYMVKNSVWARAMENLGVQRSQTGTYLCLPCLEEAVGRPLRRSDFPEDLPVNRGILWGWDISSRQAQVGHVDPENDGPRRSPNGFRRGPEGCVVWEGETGQARLELRKSLSGMLSFRVMSRTKHGTSHRTIHLGDHDIEVLKSLGAEQGNDS